MTSSSKTDDGTHNFPTLFTPIKVGPMTVANRICETTNSIGAGAGGPPMNDAFISHHVAKARGGTAWIGSETVLLNSPMPEDSVDEMFEGAGGTRFAMYKMPGYVDGVRKFTDAVHDAGAVAVFQLTHLNSTMAASARGTAEAYDFIPHEMTEEEIEFVINTYVDAAEVFKEANADGVEIHCAHEALPQMFLSPATNGRTDKWGGDAVGRTRLIVEALRRMKERVGDSLAVGIRINGMESRLGGYDLLQLREMVTVIAGNGNLDFVDLDVGHSWGRPSYVQPGYYDPAQYREAGKAVKVDIAPIPVLFTGRINEPTVAEELLTSGHADLVGMTRAGIADPDFANKVREGRMVDMRRCIACNRCIGEVIHGKSPMRKPSCSVNPTIGNEILWEQKFKPAETKKRIVIAGGGAAGLETARIAAERGHEVIVFERDRNLGGQVRIASKAPGRHTFEDFIYYEENQLNKLGVEVRTGAEATVEDILALNPDSVVCATGSVPITPDIPGVDADNVVQGWDVLENRAQVGDRVAVIGAEDHTETINVADYIADKGKSVEIFHKWLNVGREVDRYSIGAMMARLEQGDVKIHHGLRLASIDGGKLFFSSAYTGFEQIFEGFDTVVLVYGSEPDPKLYQGLEGKVPERFLVGSAWVPRGMYEATQHAMRVALEI
ncbi:MAG TPA: FAD-dependent oxidoreductase [Dehalococcoidia bacterium]|nr:FAD-dependent oxidoreductase [Dehalococcoidia bacterium]